MYIDGDFVGIKTEPESDDVAEFPPDDNPTTGMHAVVYITGMYAVCIPYYRYVSCMYTGVYALVLQLVACIAIDQRLSLALLRMSVIFILSTVFCIKL